MSKKQPVISMVGDQLVACMVTEEEVAPAASTPFATAAPGRRNVYYISEGGLSINHVPAMMESNNSISKDSIMEELQKITEGIPAPKAAAIHDSVLSSYGIIDPEEVYEYEPNSQEQNELKAIYDAMLKQLEDMKSSGSGGAVGNKLDKYFFKKHILLQGEKGGGKTYMVTKMLTDMKEKITAVDIRGNEGMEAIDLLGYYIKTNSGDLVWKDGPLTAAFRAAAKGEKTILFIDEMLRIPKRELNVLVGSLSPDADGNYKLDTNQADAVEIDADGRAIASIETITIPKDMLWCVGTTNAGAGYAVDNIDEALGDRFRTIIKRTGEKEMQDILAVNAKNYGHTKKEVAKLMKFYKSYNTLKDSGELTKLVNLRHMCEIMEFSEPGDLADAAYDLIPTWTTQDQHGYPNESQSAIIEGLIEKELL